MAPRGMILATYLMLAMICLVHVDARPRQRQRQQTCNVNVKLLMAQCARYVQKSARPVEVPSLGCCSVVRSLNVRCICRSITPAIENMVDMSKVFRVAAFCGRRVPRGTKCGRIRAPWV